MMFHNTENSCLMIFHRNALKESHANWRLKSADSLGPRSFFSPAIKLKCVHKGDLKVSVTDTAKGGSCTGQCLCCRAACRQTGETSRDEDFLDCSVEKLWNLASYFISE